MFTINIKGKANPKDLKMVKLEMIFFKTGYNRTSQTLNISGPLNEWDNKSQSFSTNHSAATAKNKMLFDLKSQYYKVAEDWNYENRIWSPIELSHCFDKIESYKAENKSLSVLQMINSIISYFKEKERCKNGQIITCVSTNGGYIEVRNSLMNFTRDVYNKKFSSYFFADINAKFVTDYILYVKKCGIKNGNKGGLSTKISKFKAIFTHAKKRGLNGVNIGVFNTTSDIIRPTIYTSKAVSYKQIDKLALIDRSLFTEREGFHLDMFLFSYYTGGVANVDVCNLVWSCIKEDHIVYERTKCSSIAKPILINKSRQIIEKYKGQGVGDFVFPVFKEQHTTHLKKIHRTNAFTGEVNTTLAKACRVLKIKERITWYTARASFITRMVDKGYHPCAVAEMAGNSPAVIYKHYYKNTQEGNMLKDMNQMFGE